MMKKQLKYSAIILICALASSAAVFSARAETLQEAVKEIKKDISDLLIKKEENPTEEAKWRLEIFEKILELSLKETNETISQLKAVEDLSETETNLQKQLLAKFNEFSKFSEEQQKLTEDIKNKEKFDLNEVKEIAQNFKDWRNKIYLPEMQTASDFIFLHQEKLVLEITEKRYTKIASDLKKFNKKIDAENFKKLEDMMKQADKLIKEAAKFSQKAENNFWLAQTAASLRDSIASTSLSSGSSTLLTYNSGILSTASSSLRSNASSSLNSNATSSIVNASSSLNASSTTINASSSEAQTGKNTSISSIKGLLDESLNKIKDSYQVFIEMSNLIKKTLI